ncbi:hypothetical protein FF021_04215 [Leptospira noguchii]|nr:hypothetical protein FF021_04215 [Leptospira noguchii]
MYLKPSHTNPIEISKKLIEFFPDFHYHLIICKKTNELIGYEFEINEKTETTNGVIILKNCKTKMYILMYREKFYLKSLHSESQQKLHLKKRP